jgi:hypothetical protein
MPARGVAADGEVQGGGVINKVERLRRQDAVRNAVAIAAFEGGAPSDYAVEQMRKFVAGEITVEEMRDRVVTNASRPTV